MRNDVRTFDDPDGWHECVGSDIDDLISKADKEIMGDWMENRVVENEERLRRREESDVEFEKLMETWDGAAHIWGVPKGEYIQVEEKFGEQNFLVLRQTKFQKNCVYRP